MEDFDQQTMCEKIENIIGYSFKNKDILNIALTHSSYAHKFCVKNNERLEFLGDSVLGFIVAEFLFEKFKEDEGMLTKMRANLVSCEFLSKIVTENKLFEFIKTSPENLKFNETVKGDFFEALLGAMFLDGGIQICKEFVHKTLNLNKENVLSVFASHEDYKTKLQEKVQAKQGKIEYVLLSVSGPDNSRVFEMQLLINNTFVSKAKALSKQKAENECAKIALKNGALRRLLQNATE
ncbi:MAG: ribonuclease III [Christensenellales bacterium]